jgi:hypothetical protein
MEGKDFDQLIKRLEAGAGRRHMLGGLVGATAALLTGATVLEAKRGGHHKGKAKGKGKAKKSKGTGAGVQKVTICHANGSGGYEKLTLGAPGADNHLRTHPEDEPFNGCCPDDTCAADVCFTSSCVGGACSTPTPADEGTPCTTSTGAAGTCDINNDCVPTP